MTEVPFHTVTEQNHHWQLDRIAAYAGAAILAVLAAAQVGNRFVIDHRQGSVNPTDRYDDSQRPLTVILEGKNLWTSGEREGRSHYDFPQWRQPEEIKPSAPVNISYDTTEYEQYRESLPPRT